MQSACPAAGVKLGRLVRCQAALNWPCCWGFTITNRDTDDKLRAFDAMCWMQDRRR